MGITQGELIDEGHLDFSNDYGSSRKNHANKRQMVVVAPAFYASTEVGGKIEVDVYMGRIGDNNVMGGWEWVNNNRISSTVETYGGNIASAGVNRVVATDMRAVVWKIRFNPQNYSGLFETYHKSTVQNYVYAIGYTTGHKNYFDTYGNQLQGHRILLLKGGHRVYDLRSYTNDSPKDYVKFRKGGDSLGPGDTIVFAP